MTDFTFERERIFAFSDAVFSIAITLLILDISIPDHQVWESENTWKILGRLIPNFIGFLVSFFVIALYWKFYLIYSRYITEYDTKLFWLNILLLLFIVLLPFSTSFFVERFNFNGPFVFSCANLIMLSLINFFLLNAALRRSSDKLDVTTQRWLRFRAKNTVIVWTLALVLSFIWPIFARFFFIALFVFQAIGKRYYKRKAKRLNME